MHVIHVITDFLSVFVFLVLFQMIQPLAHWLIGFGFGSLLLSEEQAKVRLYESTLLRGAWYEPYRKYRFTDFQYQTPATVPPCHRVRLTFHSTASSLLEPILFILFVLFILLNVPDPVRPHVVLTLFIRILFAPLSVIVQQVLRSVLNAHVSTGGCTIQTADCSKPPPRSPILRPTH